VEAALLTSSSCFGSATASADLCQWLRSYDTGT